jgi:hypothetical protein
MTYNEHKTQIIRRHFVDAHSHVQDQTIINKNLMYSKTILHLICLILNIPLIKPNTSLNFPVPSIVPHRPSKRLQAGVHEGLPRLHEGACAHGPLAHQDGVVGGVLLDLCGPDQGVLYVLLGGFGCVGLLCIEYIHTYMALSQLRLRMSTRIQPLHNITRGN